MGDYLYLVCLDHDPPLRSHDEVSQNAAVPRELERIRDWVADREELVRLRRKDQLTYEDYFLNHAVLFFASHLKCRLEARDDVGDGRRYDVMPKPPPRPRIVR